MGKCGQKVQTSIIGQISSRAIKYSMVIIVNHESNAQVCLTLCDPMDYRPPGSSVCGILQARTLEWVDIPFSRRPSQPTD